MNGATPAANAAEVPMPVLMTSHAAPEPYTSASPAIMAPTAVAYRRSKPRWER